MMSIQSLAVVLLACLKALHGAQVSVGLDKNSNQCGSTWKLVGDSELGIYGTGNAPNGYCGTLIYAVEDPDSNCRFPGMCARLTSGSVAGCNGKLAFTGKYSDKTGDHTNELSCYSGLGRDFCTQGFAMRVEVVEELEYSMKKDEEKNGYKFNVTVYRQCFEKKEVRYVNYAEDDYRAPNLEEGWRSNYIIGIVVACCLASIFLVTLVIMKFYYKNKPYSGLKE